ncbi:hypothetical protein BH24ACT3_BH24ACT3_17090 [soil metagenome]
MRRRRRLTVVAALVTVAAVLLPARPAGAHPLGNFTTNTATRLEVGVEWVRIDYTVDLAEIPALRELQGIDGDGDGSLDPDEPAAYAGPQCETLLTDLALTVDGADIGLDVVDARVSTPAGEAGLDTLRLECRIEGRGRRLDGETPVTFADGTFPDRLGWREVTAVGDLTTIVSAYVAEESLTDQLRTYPEDRLGSPLAQRRATLVVRPGGAAAGSGATVPEGTPRSPIPGAERFNATFTELVAEQRVTVPFVVLAFGLSVLLGSLHALAPGHGKTVMAAYLVGRRSDRRLSLLLGATVASSHTLGVVLLGLVVTVSERIAPERLYPVLGAVSGLLFAAIGVTLLRQALRRRRHGRALAATGSDRQLVGAGGGHHHDGHDHGGEGHDGHGHGHHHHLPPPGSDLTWRSVVAPGLAGGLVPSPSAVLVFLAGITLGRAWFGLLLVLAYGLGVGLSLVGAGYVLVRARDAIERRLAGARWQRVERVTAALPIITAVLVVAGGATIAIRAVAAA